ERDLKPLRQQIRQFDAFPVESNQHEALPYAHVQRLRERAQAIETEIARAETQATLHGWNHRTDPELAAAIDRRTNHLAHVALAAGDPGVGQLSVLLTNMDPEATADSLRVVIAVEVAKREMGEINRLPWEPFRPAPRGLASHRSKGIGMHL
ncbi:hypothetical protein, partial [Gemmatimonas sp.]|uniref:hypothetical protein n=1 Tax=Gemmatimonas sp. TaxID=1962908 RepID=UPI0035673F24